MTQPSPNSVAREDVFQVLASFQGCDAVVVGGQSLTLWAERYFNRTPELIQYAPFVSKDIDYLGFRDAAIELAKRLGAKSPTFPDLVNDQGTHSTAIVHAEINGHRILIDFIGGLIGVAQHVLKDGVVQLAVPYLFDDQTQFITVQILHPILVLQSRAVNWFHPARNRHDDITWRQLHTAAIVVREHILERLEQGDNKDATYTVKQLFQWLRNDHIGKLVDLDPVVNLDLLNVLKEVSTSPLWDSRFASITLTSMINRIEDFRVGRNARMGIFLKEDPPSNEASSTAFTPPSP